MLTELQMELAFKIATYVGKKKQNKTWAEESGISPVTLSRWKRNPEFAATVNKFRDELQSRIIHRIEKAQEPAVDTLTDLAQNKDDQLKGKIYKLR